MSNLDQQIAWPLIGVVAFWSVVIALSYLDSWSDKRRRARKVAFALAQPDCGPWINNVPGFDPTPIYDRLAAEVFADELADDVAVARWLG